MSMIRTVDAIAKNIIVSEFSNLTNIKDLEFSQPVGYGSGCSSLVIIINWKLDEYEIIATLENHI